MKKLAIFLISTCIFWSCQEDKLLTYDENISGRSIYFLEKFNKKVTDSIDRPISFGFAKETVKDSILRIPIALAGYSANEDLGYSVNVVDSSTMIRGEHFDFVREPVIRKGRVVDTLELILYRKAELLEQRKFLTLNLVPNQNFNTNIATKVNSNVKHDILSLRISSDDMFPVSYHWQGSIGTTVIAYFGEYSREKALLMIDVLGIEPDVLFDPTRGNMSVQSLVSWSSYLKYWLSLEKEAGRVYYDAKGNEITMGKNAR